MAQGRAGFRVGGIPVHTPLSAWLGVLFIAWIFAPSFSTGSGRTSTFLVAALFGVLVYAATLVHELAHAGAARAFGYRVHRIELHVLGGLTSYERPRSTPGRELAIALAGPAATLAVAAVSWLAAEALRGAVFGSLTHTVLLLLLRLAEVSLLIGAYNLLPGLPLDGGSMVKCGVWKATRSESTGTLVGGYAGLVVAAFVAVLPFVLAVTLGQGAAPDMGSIVLGALLAGWLAVGALGAIRRAKNERTVDSLSVAALMDPAVVVAAGSTVADARRRYHSAPGLRLVVVDVAGTARAVVLPDALAAVPADRADAVTVDAVARTLVVGRALPVSMTGGDLVAAVGSAPAHDYLVADEHGTLVGVLELAAVNRALAGGSVPTG